MASRARLWDAVCQALLCATGIGLVYALQAHLYACALVLALVALWRVGAAVWPNWPRPKRLEGSRQPNATELEHRLLTSLLDQTPAPLLTRDADGVIRAGNRAARALFATDDRLLAPPKALLDAIAASPSEGATVSLQTPSGSRAFALSITDLAGADGVLRLTVLIDIQPELRAAEASALRDLLQVLSHEIMNALTPVASLAATALDLLADDTSTSKLMARDAVETLERRAAGLARFVEAYRTLARLPPPDLQPTSLTALSAEACRLFRSRWTVKGVALEAERPAEDLIVWLDNDLMVHALINVMSNAAEAALMNTERPPVVRLTLRALENGAVISVEDSGSGLAESLDSRIFQPFFTTKPEGSGVGLSFARQVALGHGGDLILQPSREGCGANFTFFMGR